MSAAPAPLATIAARPGRRTAILLGLLVIVLALFAVGVGIFVAGPRLCVLTEPERHGLACDIPLPANAQFAEQPNSGNAPTGEGIEAWAYTVSATDATAIVDLYDKRLPETGWTCIRTNKVELPGSAEATVSAISSNRALFIAVNPAASPGEVQLLIVVTTFPQAPGGGC